MASSVETTANLEAPTIQADNRLSLRANFTWTFVGNVVYAACQWGMLVVLAKVARPDTVGSFALALAVTAPVIMLTNLQLRAVQATDARHEYTFGHYLGLRLSMTTLAIFIIAGIVAISGYQMALGLVILAVGVAKCFESISDVSYGALQQHERMDRISISMIIKGVVSLIALTLAVVLTGEMLWGAVALAASWGLVMTFYDLPNAASVLRRAGRELIAGREEGRTHFLTPSWDFRKLARLAWLALPLGIVMLLISLNSNIPRYFVQQYNGTHDLGIFAAIAYLMTAANTVIGALGQSASPRLAQHHTRGETAAFRALEFKLLGIAAVLGVAGVLVAATAGPQILTLLYTREYAAYADVFVLVMVSVGLWNLASSFGYIATARRRLRLQAVVLFAIVAVSISAGFLLVPSLGLQGAAISMVISSVVAVVSYALLCF